MLFQQFFVEGLAHASYLVGCEKEKCCAIVDPQRDIDIYIEEAERRGVSITHTFLTHLHADFVAGHCELAAQLGAKIYLARQADAQFPHVPLDDNTRVPIGNVVIQAISTPGHTPEGMTFAVYDSAAAAAPTHILTGDTLFVGDVGRVDLFGPRKAESLATQLYSSLFDKLLTLPDDVEVFPAHGAGSLCARVICDERSSTIGRQRKENYALNFPDKGAFVQAMVEGVPETPAYFVRMVSQNRSGPSVLNGVPQPVGLSARQVEERLAAGALLVDTRSPKKFGAAHIPGSYSISAGVNFSTWAGWVLPENRPIILLPNKVSDLDLLVRQLIRVGYDQVAGYLDGGFAAWSSAGLPTRQLRQMSAEQLHEALAQHEISQVVDVRADGEWHAGHLQDALHIPVGNLPQRYSEVGKGQPVAVICAGGFRSSLACSILLQHGYENLTNVMDGMTAWLKNKGDTSMVVG